MSEKEIFDYIAEIKSELDEINTIRGRIRASTPEKLRVKIETKQWFGFSEPFLAKEHSKIYASKKTMLKLLSVMEDEAKKEINIAIDLLIKTRKEKNNG